MVERIIGGKGPGPLHEARGNRKTDTGKAADKSTRSDSVQFSDLLQQAEQPRSVELTSETHRSEKLQALKQQIANGEYRPDLEKVAASLLRFIVEEQP